MTKPFVSVIILNWNGKNWLDPCLRSLASQSNQDFEVIITDNGSTDDSQEFVKTDYPNYMLLENGENLGYTGANNNASKAAEGEYLLFLNNDTWLESNFLQSLNDFVSSTQANMIAPLILPYNELNKSKHIPFTGMDKFGYPAVVAMQPFYVDGCCLIIKKELFLGLGGFDSRYFIFLEDVDLSWRAQIYGEKIQQCLACVVHHECGGSIAGSMQKGAERHTTSTKRRYMAERNLISNVIKNYETHNLIWILPVTLTLSLGEAFLYFISGKFSGSKAIINAVVWNIKNIKSTLNLRHIIQQNRKVKDSELFKSMINGIAKWRAFKDVGGVPNVKN